MKKTIKSFLSFSIIVLLCFAFMIPVSANSDNHQENNLSYKDNETMTFDQMVEKIALEQNDSVNNVITEIIENEVEAEVSKKRSFVTSGQREEMEVNTLNSLRSASYAANEWKVRVHTGFLNMGNYHPTIRIYYQTNNNGGASKILNVSMNRAHEGSGSGLAFKFDGKIYVNLESASRVYYEVNGDYYRYGNQTSTTSVSIGIGATGQASYSVTSSDSHFKYYANSYTKNLFYGGCPMSSDPDDMICN